MHQSSPASNHRVNTVTDMLKNTNHHSRVKNMHLQIWNSRNICMKKTTFWRWITSQDGDEMCVNQNQSGLEPLSLALSKPFKRERKRERQSFISSTTCSPIPPLFLRLALLASCPAFDSSSLVSSPIGSTWASWFSLLSPPSWLLSDFLSGRSLFFSLSLRKEGGFFPLLLRTFCCC